MTPAATRPALVAAALLFDLDGVLVDSRACIEFIWRSWGRARGREVEPILRVAHGRRISDTLAEMAPDLNLADEVAWLDALEEREFRGVAPVPGAAELLRGLPPDRWAVVTSGSPRVAEGRIEAAGLPRPPLLSTAADVTRGKPAPEGYLLAAATLGVDPARCLVFEDAPAGVAAGKAAGMTVIGVEGTVSGASLRMADQVIPRVALIKVDQRGDGLIEVSLPVPTPDRGTRNGTPPQ